jgi:oxalate decarboxylase
MRLGPDGVRELHWHQQAEWAVMTYGNCRVTVLDQDGRPAVADVKEGDFWYFPAGLPHSLQGLDPDGAEFVLAFDNGASSEFNTLMATNWIAHTPPEVLAKNFGVPVDAFKNIPLQNGWMYQSNVAAPPRQQLKNGWQRRPASRRTRSCSGLPICDRTGRPNGGSVRIADSTNFIVSKTIAAALVTVKPGGMREMHWHPNADEWQYCLKGAARMTVFNIGPAAVTADFHPGAIGYVQKGLGHYIENTGTTDLVAINVFRTDRFQEVALSDWLAHSPPDMVAETLNLDPAVIAQFPRNRLAVVPI